MCDIAVKRATFGGCGCNYPDRTLLTVWRGYLLGGVSSIPDYVVSSIESWMCLELPAPTILTMYRHQDLLKQNQRLLLSSKARSVNNIGQK